MNTLPRPSSPGQWVTLGLVLVTVTAVIGGLYYDSVHQDLTADEIATTGDASKQGNPTITNGQAICATGATLEDQKLQVDYPNVTVTLTDTKQHRSIVQISNGAITANGTMRAIA